jgi:hypothetical protein
MRHAYYDLKDKELSRYLVGLGIDQPPWMAFEGFVWGDIESEFFV